MTRPRAYHHGALRDTLVRLATEAIARGGVEAVSVRALAREAGVAHRAAYQHFADKESLVAAALTAGYERLSKILADRLDPASPPSARLEAIAAAYAVFADQEPAMFLAMTGPRINASGAYPELEAALRASWRHVIDAVSEGAESGEFNVADKAGASAIFWGGLQGILAQTTLNRIKVKPSQRAAFFRQAATRLVAALKA